MLGMADGDILGAVGVELLDKGEVELLGMVEVELLDKGEVELLGMVEIEFESEVPSSELDDDD